MNDREKKIADIREWHEGKRDPFPPFTVFEAVGVMLDELDRIQQEYAEEREMMIKALKFYANEDNWRSTRFVVGRAEADSGQTAQDVLKKIGVTVE